MSPRKVKNFLLLLVSPVGGLLLQRATQTQKKQKFSHCWLLAAWGQQNRWPISPKGMRQMEKINNGQNNVNAITSTICFILLWGRAPQFSYNSLPLKTSTFPAEEICGLSCIPNFCKGAYGIHQELKLAFKPMTSLNISLNHLAQTKLLSLLCIQSLFPASNKSHSAQVSYLDIRTWSVLMCPPNVHYFRQWGKIREHPPSCESLTGFFLPAPTREVWLQR